MLVRTHFNTTGVWCWWKFARRNVEISKKCAILLKILVGSHLHELDASRDRCYVCGESVRSKGAHILYECEMISDTRRECRRELMNVLPLDYMKTYIS